VSRNKLFVLLLLNAACFAQSGKLLHFRVVPDCASCGISVQAINVVDVANEQSAESDAGGQFSLRASAGDVLILQKETFEYMRKVIEAEDLSQPEIVIRMIPKPIELKEVVVAQKKAPDDLIQRHVDHTKFTPAERKLYTATTGLLDPLLNLISGRTKQLKKQLDTEMKERLLARLETQFDDDYYTSKLKIPADYIRDFQYYMIEDDDFVFALKDKNRTRMQFEAARLSLSYRILMHSAGN